MADIGDNCVIGAGSVVTRPVPHNSVAVGNPARVIRATFADVVSQPGQRAHIDEMYVERVLAGVGADFRE
jgi:serine acetyltransferase